MSFVEQGPNYSTGAPLARDLEVMGLSGRPGCLGYLIFTLVGLWIVIVTVFINFSTWFAEQFVLIEELDFPVYAWPAVTWGQAVLLAIVVAPLAIFTVNPVLRAVYRTWLVAIGFLFVLGFARFFPFTATQPATVAQVVLGFVSLLAVVIFIRTQGWRLGWPWRSAVPALALAPLVALPWLAFGAVGSPLDMVLDLLAGLVLGLFAGILLSHFLIEPIDGEIPPSWWSIGFGGLAAGLALTILGSALGLSGSQMLLLISLPPLGFAAVMVGRFAPSSDRTIRSWLPVALFLGLAAAAPLMFVDPTELSLLLGFDDVLGWAFRAAGLAFLLALLVGFALALFRSRLAETPRLALVLPGLALAWLIGALVYFGIGQPGFYGEQMFVILRDQADVSAAKTIPDRGDRLTYVYTTLIQQADNTQANLRSTLNRLDVPYRPYYLVNAIEVDGGPILRLYLSRQPEVDRILDSPHLRPLPAPLPEGSGDQGAPSAPPWNVTSIGADRVWHELGVTGKGIVVGQSDSGVQGDHPALRDGYRGRQGQNDYNWIDPWNGTHSPTDVGGHGTHTLGSILGRGGIGVAPDAEWFACVNLARDLGNPGLYLNCMQFMLAPYPQGGDPFKDGDPSRAAHVINNSWGCPTIEGCDAKVLAPAVNALRAAGIFVVASAGNAGPRCSSVTDPIAIYDGAVTVGAVDSGGTIADFSSRGPVTVDGSGRVKPDIAAPGVNVLSSLPHNTYGLLDGTSMAGPHVVGVVALMWSAQPKLIGDIDRTEQILLQTARPQTNASGNCSQAGPPNDTYGYGLVDAYAAVQAALAVR